MVFIFVLNFIIFLPLNCLRIDFNTDDGFHGVIKENEYTVYVTPPIKILPKPGLTICNYNLSSDTVSNIPFIIYVKNKENGYASILATQKLNCQKVSLYHLYLKAIPCDLKRFNAENIESPNIPLKIQVLDVNEYDPYFEQRHYYIDITEGIKYQSIIQLKAFDKDCSFDYNSICSYRIISDNSESQNILPFAISNDGIITNVSPLNESQIINNYNNNTILLRVVAYDCGGRKSKPAFVHVTVHKQSDDNIINMSRDNMAKESSDDRSVCRNGWRNYDAHKLYTPINNVMRIAPHIKLKLCPQTLNQCEQGTTNFITTIGFESHLNITHAKGCDRGEKALNPNFKSKSNDNVKPSDEDRNLLTQKLQQCYTNNHYKSDEMKLGKRPIEIVDLMHAGVEVKSFNGYSDFVTVNTETEIFDNDKTNNKNDPITKLRAKLNKRLSNSPNTHKPQQDMHKLRALERMEPILGYGTNFSLTFWMRHSNLPHTYYFNNYNNNNSFETDDDGILQTSPRKEHIFCRSDDYGLSRHHLALFLKNCKLILLLRQEILLFNDVANANDKTTIISDNSFGSEERHSMFHDTTDGKESFFDRKKLFTPSEIRWKLDQVCDNEWHHYVINVFFPTHFELFIDGVRFQQQRQQKKKFARNKTSNAQKSEQNGKLKLTNNKGEDDTFEQAENPQIIDDWPLHPMAQHGGKRGHRKLSPSSHYYNGYMRSSTPFLPVKSVVGACWEGRKARMDRFFTGALSELALVKHGVWRESVITQCLLACREALIIDSTSIKSTAKLGELEIKPQETIAKFETITPIFNNGSQKEGQFITLRMNMKDGTILTSLLLSNVVQSIRAQEKATINQAATPSIYNMGQALAISSSNVESLNEILQNVGYGYIINDGANLVLGNQQSNSHPIPGKRSIIIKSVMACTNDTNEQKAFKDQYTPLSNQDLTISIHVRPQTQFVEKKALSSSDITDTTSSPIIVESHVLNPINNVGSDNFTNNIINSSHPSGLELVWNTAVYDYFHYQSVTRHTLELHVNTQDLESKGVPMFQNVTFKVLPDYSTSNLQAIVVDRCHIDSSPLNHDDEQQEMIMVDDNLNVTNANLNQSSQHKSPMGYFMLPADILSLYGLRFERFNTPLQEESNEFSAFNNVLAISHKRRNRVSIRNAANVSVYESVLQKLRYYHHFTTHKGKETSSNHLDNSNSPTTYMASTPLAFELRCSYRTRNKFSAQSTQSQLLSYYQDNASFDLGLWDHTNSLVVSLYPMMVDNTPDPNSELHNNPANFDKVDWYTEKIYHLKRAPSMSQTVTNGNHQFHTQYNDIGQNAILAQPWIDSNHNTEDDKSMNGIIGGNVSLHSGTSYFLSHYTTSSSIIPPVTILILVVLIVALFVNYCVKRRPYDNTRLVKKKRSTSLNNNSNNNYRYESSSLSAEISDLNKDCNTFRKKGPTLLGRNNVRAWWPPKRKPLSYAPQNTDNLEGHGSDNELPNTLTTRLTIDSVEANDALNEKTYTFDDPKDAKYLDATNNETTSILQKPKSKKTNPMVDYVKGIMLGHGHNIAANISKPRTTTPLQKWVIEWKDNPKQSSALSTFISKLSAKSSVGKGLKFFDMRSGSSTNRPHEGPTCDDMVWWDDSSFSCLNVRVNPIAANNMNPDSYRDFGVGGTTSSFDTINLVTSRSVSSSSTSSIVDDADTDRLVDNEGPTNTCNASSKINHKNFETENADLLDPHLPEDGFMMAGQVYNYNLSEPRSSQSSNDALTASSTTKKFKHYLTHSVKRILDTNNGINDSSLKDKTLCLNDRLRLLTRENGGMRPQKPILTTNMDSDDVIENNFVDQEHIIHENEKFHIVNSNNHRRLTAQDLIVSGLEWDSSA